jgi:hypothetical protein
MKIFLVNEVIMKSTIRYLTISERHGKNKETKRRKTMPRFRSEVPKGLFRVPISITKEMEDWLQDLGNQMKSSGGYKLPKSYIIRALLEAAMTFKIDVCQIKTEEELVKRIKDSVKGRK